MPAGNIATVLYWYPGLGTWVDLATGVPEVPASTEFAVACGWINTGALRAAGHVDAIVTKPDGTQVTLLATEGQDLVADPGSSKTVGFRAIVFDQPGDYQGEFVLKMMDEAAGVTARVGWASIWPYVVIAYYWGGQGWIQVLYDTILVDGMEYHIQVTQNCVLNYNGYYFQLYAGWNQITWQPGGAGPPTGVTFTLVGYNYPAWVTQEEIIIWDGQYQLSGLRAPGVPFTVSIPGDSVYFQFNLFGSKYPGGIGLSSRLGGIANGSTIRIDMGVFIPEPYR